MPYLDMAELYEEYDFSHGWNSPANRSVIGCQPPVFIGPDFNGRTRFVVVVGKETAFPYDRAMSSGEITDGLSKTILIVQCTRSDIHWAEPRDLKFDQIDFSVNGTGDEPAIGSQSGKGAVVAFADGHVTVLSDRVDPSVLKALLTANGGEELSETW